MVMSTFLQVDSELRTCRHCDLERLPLPVEIELRACEERLIFGHWGYPFIAGLCHGKSIYKWMI